MAKKSLHGMFLSESRDVRVLSLACMLSFAGLGAYFPFLSLYFKHYGLNFVQIGTISSISATVALFAQNFWGVFSDRVGKRIPFIFWGNILNAMMVLAYTTMSSFTAFLAIGVVAALLVPSPIALMAATVLEHSKGYEKGETYAKYRIWGAIGWIIVTFVIGYLISEYGLKSSFYLASALCLSSAFAARFAGEPKKHGLVEEDREIRDVLTDRAFVTFILASMIIQVTVSMCNTFLSLYLDFLGASPQIISLSWSVQAIPEVPFMLYAGKLSDRIGRKPLIVFSFAVAALRWFLYTVILDPILLLSVQLLHGITFGVLNIASVTYISDILPPRKQGVGQTLYMAALMLGGVIGPYSGGIVSEVYGLIVIFRLASLIALISTFSSITLKRLK